MKENDIVSIVEASIKKARYNKQNDVLHPDDEHAIQATSHEIENKIQELQDAKEMIRLFLVEDEPLYA